MCQFAIYKLIRIYESENVRKQSMLKCLCFDCATHKWFPFEIDPGRNKCVCLCVTANDIMVRRHSSFAFIFITQSEALF